MNNITRTIFNLVFLLFAFSINKSEVMAEHWCYTGANCGPNTWGGYCRAGKSQSPINLERRKSTDLRNYNKRLFLTNYNAPVNFYMQNDGHTVKVLLKKDGTSHYLLRGFGNVPHYYLSQMHFHWGANSHDGSEHRINGNSFPLELHMVHRHGERFAVLGILFHLSSHDNPNLRPIIENLSRVMKPSSSSISISHWVINVGSLLPHNKGVFLYSGSLTTPPCTEKVAWLVFKETVAVSARQLAAFRWLRDHDGNYIIKNNRPIQPTFTSKRKSVNFMSHVW